MEKSELDILLETQKELAALKERVAVLEHRLAAIQAVPEAPEEAAEVDFTDVDLGDAGMGEPVAEAPVAEAPAVEAPVVETPVVETPVAETPAAEEPVAEEPVLETPVVEAPKVEEAPAAAPKADITSYAWYKDRPGILVKNIRSGISLLDRAQFIGTLFKEDFGLYDATIAALNEMTSLEEAVAYVNEHFPQWNMGSDVAYRFMMAVRKKLG